jgi:hypothetical protein
LLGAATATAALVLVVLLTGRPSAASEPHKEKPYALIYGTVFDPDGVPVYGVKVKIRRSEEKKARWELMSDHRGEFAQRVPPGKADYVVWADFKDYKLPSGRHLKPGTEVTVHIYNEERADTGLHLIW